MKDKVQSILDKLDSANVTCINYDYYFKGNEMVEDSFEYCDEFDTLYELLIINVQQAQHRSIQRSQQF